MVLRTEDITWAHSKRSDILSFFESTHHSSPGGDLDVPPFPRIICTGKLVLETYVPGSRRNEFVDDELHFPRVCYRPSGEVRNLSNKIYMSEKVRGP